MKKFKTHAEDTTTASVVGTGDDASTVVVKRKRNVSVMNCLRRFLNENLPYRLDISR